jgi:5'(3')-deoxyribonucleotidase
VHDPSPLRIAFDMDGTLADLSSAFTELEERLFGPADTAHGQPAPELREVEQHHGQAPADAGGQGVKSRRNTTERRDDVWQAIESTPDFWTTLKPIDASAIARLYALTGAHNWEVFFITQRPQTAGGTVQRQTHKWLVDHGFPTPSVIPLSGGRGRAAAALRLDYLVDDTPQNCVDVLSDSTARAILLVHPDDALSTASARRLGIGTAHSIGEALDLLVRATAARANPSLFEKLRKVAGWK